MKEKKKRVPRKDRFKIQKKRKYDISTAPAFLHSKYGISEVSITGVVKTGETYTKLYKVNVGNFDKQHEGFQILREYNISFRIYYIDENIYMMVKVKEENLEAAVELLDKIEADLFVKYSNIGIRLESVITNERFRLAHKYIKNGMANKIINVGSYYEDILEWKADFELKEYQINAENGELESETEHYIMFYLTRLPNHIKGVLEEISELDSLREIMFDFEPVKDQAVAAFVKANYMGYEGELRKLKKNDPAVYNIYTGDNMDADTKHYTTCGISFMLAKEKDETFDNDCAVLEQICEKYNLKPFYYYNALEIYQEFLPLKGMCTGETRLYKSAFVERFLLAGYCEEKYSSLDDEDIFMGNVESGNAIDDMSLNAYLERVGESEEAIYDDNSDDDELDYEELIQDAVVKSGDEEKTRCDMESLFL